MGPLKHGLHALTVECYTRQRAQGQTVAAERMYSLLNLIAL